MEVRFEVRPWEDAGRELVPLVDGVSLTDLVSDFEHAAGYQPAGGYAGLVLFEFGDLGNYMYGSGESVALLGCDCGDVGCWPLQARIRVDDESVTWAAFGQPHRPGWDYSGFGPFVFRRTQYDEAVREAAGS